LHLQAAQLIADTASPSETSAKGASQPDSEVTALKAEIAQLKASLSAATAMQEVDYHTQNLWFAGTAANWPLANYYWEKILPHVRLSKTAGPAQSNSPGVENQPRMTKDGQSQIAAAIRNRDVRAFVPSYRAMLQGCYDCHKAAGKPFLRPRMPVPPAQSIISVKLNESWPQ
jgi:hypothetical protein